jgi:hypothetical protein
MSKRFEVEVIFAVEAEDEDDAWTKVYNALMDHSCPETGMEAQQALALPPWEMLEEAARGVEV